MLSGSLNVQCRVWNVNEEMPDDPSKQGDNSIPQHTALLEKKNQVLRSKEKTIFEEVRSPIY